MRETITQEVELPTMTIERSEATSRLQHQLEEGQRLVDVPMEDRFDLARAQQEKSAWSLRNRQLLFRVFEDNSGIEGYRGIAPMSARASLPLQIEHYRQELRAQLDCLQTVLARVS